ncbi:MAG: phosphoribosyltransferase [Pseudomonadota bacterium]|nr:phosphoribosyltransferase [Pseudomonadota bacterium]
MQQGIRCEIVSWGQVHRLARNLALRILEDGFAPDILVAIGRGGWIPGRLLSDYLGNLNLTEFKIEHYTGPFQEKQAARVRYPLSADISGQRVLVVDDVTDTGNSFEVAISHIRSIGEPRELRTVVLDHKVVSPFVPDYFARKVIKWRWIIYPWAVVEDLTGLIGMMPDRTAEPELVSEHLRRTHGLRIPLATIRDVLALMDRG